MVDKFRAKFYRKLGQDNRPHEYRDVLISFTALAESRLKPPNTFVWQKADYIFDIAYSKEFDRSGHPIIKYYVGNTLPAPDLNSELGQAVVKDSQNNLVIVDATILEKTFNRGEMKSIIASAQKEPQKFDWMTIIIGLCMGIPIGLIVGILLYPQIVHTVAPNAVPPVVGLIQRAINYVETRFR